MFNCSRGLLARSLVFLISGCATILGGGSSQSVSIQSTPPGATYSIQSSSGIQMGQGSTPSTISLPRKNEYQIQILAFT